MIMPWGGDNGRGVWRLYLLPLAGWVILASAGYWPTRVMSGIEGVKAMAAAQGVVVAIVYATLVSGLRRMVNADGPKRLQIGLKAGVVRFILTLATAGTIIWRGGLEPAAFLLWVGISYVVMIKIETYVFICSMRRLEKR